MPMNSPDSSPDLTPAKDFLAIGVDTVHWYPDVPTMLSGPAEFRVAPATYVDRERHRLVPGFDAHWMIDSLWRTAQRVDESELLAWIRRIFDRTRQHLSEGSGASGLLLASESLATLSGLEIQNYTHLYGVLSAPPFAHDVIQVGGPIHDRGPVHNCIVHGRCF
jgi:hypothetical protein